MLAFEVGQDGHAVIELEGVGVSCIIDEDHILHGAVEYPQVFHEVALWRDEAVLAVETVLDEILLRVEIV